MKKTFSLKNENMFTKLINKGKWYGGNYLSLYVLPNNKDFNSLGIGVPKKVGNAIKRNYIKRIIRESYKNVENNIKFGFYLLFVCKSKSDFSSIEYSDIVRDVYYLLKKAGIIIEKIDD